MRLLITGGPKTGKTALSYELGFEYSSLVRHTDDLIASMKWSDQSTEIVCWLDKPGPWAIEGVAVVRGLRKWLQWHPAGLPFDRLIYMTQPRVSLTKSQCAMATATRTIWDQITPVIAGREATHVIEYR